MYDRGENPVLRSIRQEVGWDPYDGEPTDPETLERYISALEAHVVGTDMAMTDMAKRKGRFDRRG